MIDDEETGPVLDALSSASARDVLAALEEEPATASELAKRTGLTVQNVSYHLEKLVDADLVRPDGKRGTGGNAATVYASAGRTIVATETGTQASRLTPRLGVGALGIAVGVLLTLVCAHSFVDLPVSVLAAVGYGLAHVTSLI
jgi:DNA-binding transcriptional ArsR family regulator